MALQPFTSYVTDIAPHVDGCPTAVIAFYLRKIYTDLCDRTLGWRVMLAPFNLVPHVSTYALTSPYPTDSEVLLPISDIQLIRSTASVAGATINSITYSNAVATVVTATAHNLATGNFVTVSGTTPATYTVVAAPVTVISTTSFSYPMAAVPAGNATVVGSYTYSTMATRVTIPFVPYEQAMRMYPDWPNAAAEGIPTVAFQMAPGTLCVAPVPDNLYTYTAQIDVAIRPLDSAVNAEDNLIRLYKRAMFHGTVHELMMLPGRPWSNDKLATYHGKQWEFFLNTAKAKANKGFGRGNLMVVMRPWA